MIFYYAIGGGFGHFTRARAILNTCFPGRAATIFTSLECAADFPSMKGVRVEIVSREARGDRRRYLEQLDDSLRNTSPEVLCVDTFPNGLFGELFNLPIARNPRRILIGRILKWKAYEKASGASSATFDSAILTETIPHDQLEAIEACCSSVVRAELCDPPTPLLASGIPNRYWLVDHSGPLPEIIRLLALARSIRAAEKSDVPIVVNAPCEVPVRENERIERVVSSHRLYRGAERLFTGAGFNSVRQGRLSGTRHCVIPFPRRFDDQRLRAQLNR